MDLRKWVGSLARVGAGAGLDLTRKAVLGWLVSTWSYSLEESHSSEESTIVFDICEPSNEITNA